MKEKIKILQSEIEILRDENLMKSKRLEKDRTVQRLACNQRDQMRLDVNRCQNSYREKQDLVEQQIVEIDKLSLIISSLETDMLRLKKRYESAIETRNQTGIQLIDRNDELCILYERSNIQEDTLKSGEIKLQELDQSVRFFLSLSHFILTHTHTYIYIQLTYAPNNRYACFESNSKR